MSGPIVVLGGTGFVGRRLLSLLVARGHRVRVLSRQAVHHRDLNLLAGVELLNVDPYSATDLDAAFAGASAVVNLVGILNERGFSGKGFRKAHVELTEGVIAACQRAQVPRLLQMSALRAGEGESHYLRTRGEAEALVRHSGLAWTILRPSVIFGRGDGLYRRFAGLLRLLPALVPPAQTWASDIQAPAVAFVERSFGVQGLLSSADPEQFAPAQRFDVIWVASLFSHLPQPLFQAWLAPRNIAPWLGVWVRGLCTCGDCCKQFRRLAHLDLAAFDQPVDDRLELPRGRACAGGNASCMQSHVPFLNPGRDERTQCRKVLCETHCRHQSGEFGGGGCACDLQAHGDRRVGLDRRTDHAHLQR